MKKTLLLLAAVLFCFTAFSQHRADKWFFGTLAGLDFTGGAPVAVAGQLVSSAGTAIMSDTSGAVLFYTDGMTVIDKFNQVMPNGSGLMGGFATQGALIVPQPGSDSLYFVFTVDAAGGPAGFRYSIVDMSLRSDSGDVIPSSTNILIRDTVTEKLTAVQQGSTGNYWIAVHAWGSDEFDVYELTSTGLSMTPVVSHAGISHNDSQIQNTYGQMKFSTCGDRIATAGYQDTVQVFEFDQVTGIVSNPLTIPMPAHTYGVEFSDDGRKLYVSSYETDSTLVQYDLTSWNSAAVIASRTVLSGTADIHALQIGPDEKIYVAKSFSQFLGVINAPQLAGVACNYMDSAIDLDPLFMGSVSGLALPDFVQSYFATGQSCLFTHVPEKNDANGFRLYPNPSTRGFTIELKNEEKIHSISVCDITGKVLEEDYPSQQLKISFGENLAPGIYMVIVQTETTIRTIKAIKL